MPFGSVFSKFSYISLTTAEGVKFDLKNNLLSRIALNIIGFPHVELRLRARKIFKNLPEMKKNMKVRMAGSTAYITLDYGSMHTTKYILVRTPSGWKVDGHESG